MFSWVLAWFAVLGSGIHPTVAGIVVAMFIPARGKYDTDRFVQKVKKLMGGFQCEDQSLLMRCRQAVKKYTPAEACDKAYNVKLTGRQHAWEYFSQTKTFMRKTTFQKNTAVGGRVAIC